MLFIAVPVFLLVSSGINLAHTDSEHSDRGRSPKVIRLVERIHDFTFQDTGTPGPSIGLIFTSDLFDEAGRRVGRDGPTA